MKDIYVDGGKLARNGCKTAIFVSQKCWSSVALENIKNQVQVDRGNHAQVPWCFGEFELLILNLLVQTLRPIRHYFLYSRLTHQNTVSGCWVTFSKRQTSLRLEPALMYFSSGPSITAFASEKKKKEGKIQ